MKNDTSISARLERHTTPGPANCWLWTGATDRHGYGHIKVKGRLLRAHRVSYETHVGPIPDDKQIDHLCRVRHCINPAHLEPVTGRVNTMRSPIAPAAINARKTSCNSGHRLAGSNLYVSKAGYRYCRECRRQRTAEWRTRRLSQPASR